MTRSNDKSPTRRLMKSGSLMDSVNDYRVALYERVIEIAPKGSRGGHRRITASSLYQYLVLRDTGLKIPKRGRRGR